MKVINMNIFKNKLRTYFKCTVILFVLIGGHVQCTSTKSPPKEMNKEVFTPDEGEWMIVGEIYKIFIPNKYNVNKGEGDDTQFLDIRSEKGDLVMGYETGMDDMALAPKDVETLSKEYKFTEIIKTLEEVNIRIAYKKTNATFRNIEGSVYAEQKDELSELLRFSCSDAQLDNTYKILLTLESI